MVKTHTTTSPQYTHTLLLEGGVAVAQLHSSSSRLNGEIDQKPWLKGEGWGSIVKNHTTASLQYIHTLPLKGGIALAQLHSSTNGPNGEKRLKSAAQGRKMEQYCENSYHIIPSSMPIHSPVKDVWLLLSCTPQAAGRKGKSAQVHGSREKDGVVWSKLIPHHPLSVPTHCPFGGGGHTCCSAVLLKQQAKWIKVPKSLTRGRRME
jgi:hypothetical protein